MFISEGRGALDDMASDVLCASSVSALCMCKSFANPVAVTGSDSRVIQAHTMGWDRHSRKSVGPADYRSGPTLQDPVTRARSATEDMVHVAMKK